MTSHIVADHPVQVRTYGPVPTDLIAYAARKVHVVLRHAPAAVLFVRIKLSHDRGSAPLAATARVDVDVNGIDVHARAAAPTLTEAVDLMQQRLRTRIQRIHQH
ncbi:HPF/RaiA family ribosome-associated protein [Catellatospora sp. NPDC049111]|jgi:ribosome-associated translation inhibitor RaiA|uniref:HPF/RaiA family ribosome-associated protein n=1 Tax=unclassified Catellatospora TaxID=2645785 RepID=UPI0033E37CC0